MATVSYRLEDLNKAIVGIGYVGENDHMHVLIDCKEVFDEYPDAVPTMAIVPPVGEGYPKAVTRNGDVVEWLVKDSDVTAEGDGEFQMTFTEGEIIRKSVNARFRVKRSISGSGSAPSGVQDWLTDANEKLAEVEQATQDAEAAASHQPYIGIDGYWYTWNGEEFVKNVKAQGEKGDPGDPGSPGDPTQLIDDTAGAGQTGKTWSADKLDETTSQLLNAIDGKDAKIMKGGYVLTNDVKTALIDIFDHIVFVNGNGQNYINSLKNAMEPTANCTGITADFDSSAVIYIGDDVESLRNYLTVTGTFTEGETTFTEEITNYELSGSISSAVNTITVSYKNNAATFTVVTSRAVYGLYDVVCDGTQNSIVTDIKFLTEDIDFMILVDATLNGANKRSYITSILNEESSSNDGLRISFTDNNPGYLRFRVPENTITTDVQSADDLVLKVLFLHHKSTNMYSYLYKTSNVMDGNTKKRNAAFTTSLGVIRSVGASFKGTINKIEWYDSIDYQEIRSLMGLQNKSALWEMGAISGSDASYSDSEYRVRTMGYIPEDVSAITANDGYKFYLYAWNNSGYVGYWTGSGFSKSATSLFMSDVNLSEIKQNYTGYNFRLLARKTSGPSVAISTIEAYSNIIFS